MQTYINSKLVQASPMSKYEYYRSNGLNQLIKIDPENIDDVDGFLVEDPKGISNHPDHKGRIQWLSHAEFMTEYVDLGDISTYPEFQQRMLGELAQLNSKLVALNKFTKTDQFLKLSFDDRDLLQEQCRVMSRYSDVLTKRILNAGF